MKIEYKDGNVIITIPCTKEIISNAPMSGSGKSKMIASTDGFMAIQDAPAGVKLGLNLIAKE